MSVLSRESGERLPYLPLLDLYGDAEMARLLGERARVEAWLEVERALAAAQASAGEIPAEAAEAIAVACSADRIDSRQLRERSRLVGYPILPLIEQIADGAPPVVGHYIHWGATTQDIMDTGDAMLYARAIRHLEDGVSAVGDAVAALGSEHRKTVMAGRTHGQQAVPTTFGAKVAVWLEEVSRHLDRLDTVKGRIATVQLFGAAGTAAALGPTSARVRAHLASLLDLEDRAVPGHTARDDRAELGFVLAAIAATCGKMAREVAELSRTEIGELAEADGSLRGASSTMPQKANPIDSEGIVGLAQLAVQQVPALLCAMQAAHERATGEWQIEWDSLPTLFALTAAALLTTRRLLEGLRVQTERMEENLGLDGGRIMAEAAMMALAPAVGRSRAHHLVYEAARYSRQERAPFAEALRAQLARERDVDPIDLERVLDPSAYLGEAVTVAESAVGDWKRRRTHDPAGQRKDPRSDR